MRCGRKAALRRTIHQYIKQMSERQHADEAIHQTLFASDLWVESQTIALTLSLPLEIDTSPIIHMVLKKEKRFVSRK
ncbi:MAG: hypothetical protein HZT42_04585 [Paracoccaceae bacterium]|nr:MAG: hypothetical protein HZT42_04585 [Paracoccaceae bacterium]